MMMKLFVSTPIRRVIIMITIIVLIMIIIKPFPTHDELGMCRTTLEEQTRCTTQSM